MPGKGKSLVWLPEARDDVDRLYRFLVEENPRAAEKAMRLIAAGGARLQAHPEVGRSMGDEMGRRELCLPFGSGGYVLRYVITADEIVVIRVWHAREDRS